MLSENNNINTETTNHARISFCLFLSPQTYRYISKFISLCNDANFSHAQKNLEIIW